MKYIIASVVAVLFVISFVLPLYAGTEVSKKDTAGDTSYGDKIRENNQKIATFVADTIKLPGILVGDFTDQDHAKTVDDTKYEGHDALHNLQEHIIRK